MADPRFILNAYPLFPSAATAIAPVPTVEVAQIKQKLITDGHYNTVEAAMLGSTDPATIQWTTGGPVTIGGPLATLIASTLGYDTPTMTTFLEDCAEIVL